ncbi:hypothetical protein OH76DRAFT_1488929 [Lentinus brumalis]|uniref:Uncharacterized protein n=1 Tax=Lentinus brumalis TaxID=2498619 RepID=A0A371CPL6_9APHY|nr:hypothetical protein OH76DRAFT_1488929 [Polyporus brumalis]
MTSAQSGDTAGENAQGVQNVNDILDGGEHDGGAAITHGNSQRAASYDSTALWAAIDSPTSAVDEEQHYKSKASAHEDGEVNEEEDQGPPPNQEINRTNNGEESRYQDDEDEHPVFAGEHRRPLSHHNEEPTARKRSWNGSTTSEEDKRPVRRPRTASTAGSPAFALPSIRELVQNPWRGPGSARDRSYNIPPPVDFSTPRQSRAMRNADPFCYDEQADVSGHPPTQRGSSLDTRSGAPTEDGYGRHSDRSPSVEPREELDVASMEVDPEEETRRDSLGRYPLLERPKTTPRLPTGRSRGHHSLRDILTEQETGWRNERDASLDDARNVNRAHSEAGEDHDNERFGGQERTHRRMRGQESGRMQLLSPFSAIPNTKAYEYHNTRTDTENVTTETLDWQDASNAVYSKLSRGI